MADDTPDYPGKKFGLPMTGPGSVAPMGRRLIALIVDWLLCSLIVSSITGHILFGNAQDPHYFAAQYGTLALYTFEVYLLTAISGLTIGKRLLGIRAVRTDGGNPGFKWAALRTLLLLFIIPACLSDRDLRGLHDRAADTIVVRL
ncbi:MAG: RDD family protein [Trebonia sp.]